jgi:hypothetical protein
MKITDATLEAQKKAMEYGLTITSGYRSPEGNAAVGGMKGSAHTEGRALDVAGTKADMDRFAKWAKNSGLFDVVLWQTPGHYDHVHIDWPADGSVKEGGTGAGAQGEISSIEGYAGELVFGVIRLSLIAILAIFAIIFFFSAFPAVQSVSKDVAKQTGKNLASKAKGAAVGVN